jgi:hypothetical protein
MIWLRQEVGLAQEARVPVGRPALVHDLAGEHRVEVQRLGAHHEEDVALPLLQLGRIVGDEPEQVVLRVRRHAGAQRAERQRFRPRFAGQRLEPLLEAALPRRHLVGDELGIAAAVQLAFHVDVRLEGERRVEHAFDALDAVLADRQLDAVRVRGGLLDDVAARHGVEAREQLVVPGEVGVAEHVRGHQRVLGERVAVHQEGAARVAGEHHLEDLRVAHALAHQLVDVAHAERPVRHAHRQPVHGDLGHQARRRELEVHRVIVEAERARQRLDALAVVRQLTHRPPAA